MPLYIVCILFGIILGLFLAPAALQSWNNQVGIGMNLPVMCVIMAIEGLILGFYIAYRREDRYCMASSGFFSLIVSIIWIIVAEFLITALLITAAYLAIVCVIFIGLAFVFSAGSFWGFFESRK